ncbi:MAG: HpcH/HpaI aldolase/citrate lyase family protein [Clostridiaceae bacterium]|nr:HpcH/HpaI aldolase/citrate lyase family protein [Clostridiaceae bacterium]
MRYFNSIKNKNVFYKEPEHFYFSSEKDLLSHALGATIYMPANRENLMKDVLNTSSCAVVICLEDAVPTSLVEEAERNLSDFFTAIESRAREDKDFLDALPLIFIRVRDKEQLLRLLNKSMLEGLCGLVIPKFRPVEGEKYLEIISEYNERNKKHLYVMPILETPEVIYKETRIEELLRIKKVLDNYKNLILNIRIGGTDFSGVYGLRRSSEVTIYDVTVINDCIGDIVNMFKRDDYVISAPVNEYFAGNLEVLIKEISLDKANGLLGKTAIHPKQVGIINSLMAVSKEEYLDAEAILISEIDGVIKSSYSNKMNEVKPHLKWAQEIKILSRITGVLDDGKDFRDVLK